MHIKFQIFSTFVGLIIVLNLMVVKQIRASAVDDANDLSAAFTTTITPTTTTETLSVEPAQLEVAIYYETLCPDSMYFIRRQLYYALQDNNWWPYVNLKLLPFGKADFYNNTATGEMQVFCQHGHQECELNALHACVIEGHDARQAYDLIYCMLRSYSNKLDECASSLKIDVSADSNCTRMRSTVDILKPYGEETLPLQLSFVPSIVVDKRFEPYQQSYIRYNFDTYFCEKYNLKFNVKLPNCP